MLGMIFLIITIELLVLGGIMACMKPPRPMTEEEQPINTARTEGATV
jgi:hypothetical protein